MFSEPQLIVKEIIEKSLRNMQFEEGLADGLSRCVEASLWEKFLEGKSSDIMLDFRVTLKDVTKEGEKREFMVGVNSIINGKVIYPEVINRAIAMSQEPREERICDCDSPKLYQEDKVHCAYCGGIIH